MSKPLGCLLDKQVRVAKGIWKSCKHLESKRPPLKKLAIIYVQCAEYIERIEKEHLLTSLALDLEDLRRIATEYDLDKEGSLLLSELLEATQNTNDHTKLLAILSSVSPEIDPPKLSFVSGLSLERWRGIR